MGLFSKLFGGSSRRNPMDDKPPLYGGDGSSSAQAVVVNCASMSLANRLMDGFISERHGQKDIDWKREVEMFDNASDAPEFSIRIIGVKCNDGTSVQYYFNISRPMAATKKMAKTMGTMPKGIE